MGNGSPVSSSSPAPQLPSATKSIAKTIIRTCNISSPVPLPQVEEEAVNTLAHLQSAPSLVKNEKPFHFDTQKDAAVLQTILEQLARNIQYQRISFEPKFPTLPRPVLNQTFDLSL